MCFCRRKTSEKEEYISTRGESSRKNRKEQPLPAPVEMAPRPAPIVKKEEKVEKKPRNTKPFARNRISKRRSRRGGEDDTISNIPDEMPDLEINREHPEPFYTDDQLM